MKQLLRFAYIGILASAVILTVALAQKPNAREAASNTLVAMVRVQTTDDDSRTAHRICIQLNDWIYDPQTPKRIENIHKNLDELNKLTLTGDLATLRTKLNTQMPVILPN